MFAVSLIVMCTGIDLQVLVQAHTFSCLLRLGSRPPDDEWVSDKNEDLGMLCSIPRSSFFWELHWAPLGWAPLLSFNPWLPMFAAH